MWVFEFFFQVWLYIKFLFWRGRGSTGKFLLPVPPSPYRGAEGGTGKNNPGDTLYIATANCYGSNAESVKTKFNKTGNFITVNYPKSFVGDWRFPIVVKDSADNAISIFAKFSVSEWNQLEWAVWTGHKMYDCKEWEILHIKNLRTGEWIPILSIYSLGSIKVIGIIWFFYLILHFMVIKFCYFFV